MSAMRLSGERSESGFTLIDLLFVMAVVGLLSTLAIPGLMRARGAAQTASAVGTMKVVNSAQLSFAITCGLGFYAPSFTTLGVRPPASADAFLGPELSSGPTFIKSGYEFRMGVIPLGGAPGSCNGVAPGQMSSGYAIVADPLDLGGKWKFLASNADGTLWQHDSTFASIMPQTGTPSAGEPLK
jgi:hypothetical protein